MGREKVEGVEREWVEGVVREEVEGVVREEVEGVGVRGHVSVIKSLTPATNSGEYI